MCESKLIDAQSSVKSILASLALVSVEHSCSRKRQSRRYIASNSFTIVDDVPLIFLLPPTTAFLLAYPINCAGFNNAKFCNSYNLTDRFTPLTRRSLFIITHSPSILGNSNVRQSASYAAERFSEEDAFECANFF